MNKSIHPIEQNFFVKHVVTKETHPLQILDLLFFYHTVYGKTTGFPGLCEERTHS